MRIHTLYVENFKNIKELSIDNFSNVNVVTGENGQGKSSLLEILTFLLTGSLKENKEEYVRWGEDFFLSTMTFTHKGIKGVYTVKVSEKPTERELVYGGEEYFRSDAKKKMAEILDPKLTLYSCISEQDRSTQLLFESPADRLEKIKQIFKVDKLKEVVNNIIDEIKKNKEILIRIESENSVLQNRTFNFEDEMELPNIDIEEHNNKLIKLIKDQEEYNKQYNEYKLYEEKLLQYNNSLDNIKELDLQKENLNKKYNTLQKKDIIEFNINYYEELKEKIHTLEKDIIQEESNLNIFNLNKNQYDNICKKIEDLENKLNNIGRITRIGDKPYTKEELDKAENDYYLSREEYNFCDKKLKEIQSGKCPTCGAEYTSDDISSIQQDLEKYKNNMVKVKNDLDSMSQKDKEYDELYNKNEEIKKSRENIQIQLDSLLKEKGNIPNINESPKDIISDLNNSLSEIKKEYNSLTLIYTQYNEDLDYNSKIEKELQDFNVKLVSLDSKIEEYTKVRKPREYKITVSYNEEEFKTIQEEINNYNIVKKEITNIQERNNLLREEKRKIENEIENNLDEIDKLKNKNKLLDKSKQLIDKEFSSWVISKGIGHIKKKMNEFFFSSYDGRYIIDVKQDKKSVNFFYGIDENNMKPVGMASGFEKSVLALSFRVALSKIQNLGLFLLDEVDGAADEGKSIQLAETLLKEQENQVFIITHKTETQFMLENNYRANVYEFQDGNII